MIKNPPKANKTGKLSLINVNATGVFTSCVAATLPNLITPSCTSVASLFTIKPALCKPINAIKNPIPAEIPSFKLFGIELITSVRIFVKVSKIKITPSIKTAANATFHETCIPKQTVNAK